MGSYSEKRGSLTVFIYLEKTYDAMIRDNLGKLVEKYKVQKYLVNFVKYLYENGRGREEEEKKEDKYFEVNKRI